MKETVQKLFSKTKYLSHKLQGGKLNIEIEAVEKKAICPYCNKTSDKVHSRYLRSFLDLPIKDYPVIVHLQTRKFFCKNDDCLHLTFSECFDFILPNENKTERLIFEVLRVLESNSSRKTSAILAEKGIEISKATICNLRNKKIS